MTAANAEVAVVDISKLTTVAAIAAALNAYTPAGGFLVERFDCDPQGKLELTQVGTPDWAGGTGLATAIALQSSHGSYQGWTGMTKWRFKCIDVGAYASEAALNTAIDAAIVIEEAAGYITRQMKLVRVLLSAGTPAQPDWKQAVSKQVLIMLGTDGVPGTASGTSGGMLQHLAVDVPLATLQGKTSGAAFNVGAVLPANARLLRSQINLIQALAGGTVSAAKVKLQGTGTAGELIGGAAGTDVFTGASLTAKTDLESGGTETDVNRGGQQLQATVTLTGDTMANLTAGHFSVDAYYCVVA